MVSLSTALKINSDEGLPRNDVPEGDCFVAEFALSLSKVLRTGFE